MNLNSNKYMNCSLTAVHVIIHRYNKPELLTALFGELRAAGLSRGALSYRQLLPFDQHHYHGTDDIDRVASALGWAPAAQPEQQTAARVVNFGSGLGGPARLGQSQSLTRSNFQYVMAIFDVSMNVLQIFGGSVWLRRVGHRASGRTQSHGVGAHRSLPAARQRSDFFLASD